MSNLKNVGKIESPAETLEWMSKNLKPGPFSVHLCPARCFAGQTKTETGLVL